MSTGRSLRMAWVMDPIESVDIDADTSFALMLAAQERGHTLWVVDPADLGVGSEGPTARARPVTLRREKDDHVDIGAWEKLVLDRDIDVAWQRKDPPVDAEFVTATQILGLCHRTLVLNRPASILAANEKLYALNFPDLMTDTIVTRDPDELRDYLAWLGGEMIVKPLDGKGGEGIFYLHAGDRNLSSILEQATRFGTHRTMAQRFLADVRKGDKRILLVDGEPLGAVLRVPDDEEVRANLHVGGTAAPTALDDADRRIVEQVGPWLKRDGLFFVGIDVIGGHLTEINVTSPTGIQEMGRLDGTRYELVVIEEVEALRAASG